MAFRSKQRLWQMSSLICRNKSLGVKHEQRRKRKTEVIVKRRKKESQVWREKETKKIGKGAEKERTRRKSKLWFFKLKEILYLKII